MKHRVFIIEDDGVASTLMAGWLARAGMEPVVFPDAPLALANLDEARPSCTLLDLHLPGMHGLEALRRIRLRCQQLPVIIVTSSSDAETAVEAMRAGASDFLVKPLDQDRLLTAVERCLAENACGDRKDAESPAPPADEPFHGIVGNSAAVLHLVEQIRKVGATGVSVYVSGESGAGKELVAAAVHGCSDRWDGPFVAVNCGAITESLQDSELFGHEKGAFTGAVARRRGVFEQAQRGTVFLDEVADLSSSTQVRLLRVLQNRELTRVGGEKKVPVDVRVVSATNKDLREEVRQGRFREDLFYRLVVYPIWVPPLRDHGEDIPQLVHHFVERSEQLTGCTETPISEEALTCMQAYHWPGNVRELDNVIRRALVNAGCETIEREHLPLEIRAALPVGEDAFDHDYDDYYDDEPTTEYSAAANREAAAKGSGSLTASEVEELVRNAPFTVTLPMEGGPGEMMAHAEREAIIAALIATQGRVVSAARKLGMSRATLYRRLQHYGITPGEFREATEQMPDPKK